MRRRRRKSSPLRSLFLWSVSLALIGWGLWQAELFRRSLVTPPATSQPDMAIGAVSVTQQGAQGGEPWTRPEAIEATLTILDPTPPATLTAQELAVPPAHLEATPAFDPNLTANDLITQGAAALHVGQTLAARFALNAALARTADETQAAELRSTLAALNMAVFLGGDILPDDPAARMVEIQAGDNYVTLARAYGLNAAFLQILNPSLDPNNLKPNTGIKIVQGPFHARLSKHAGRLDLYARDIYVASYTVDFPEGNYLPRGDYQVSAGTKLQLGSLSVASPRKTWIGFQGLEPATEAVSSGWIFGSTGPRGTTPKDRSTGIHLSDADLQRLYDTLTESRSHLHIEP